MSTPGTASRLSRRMLLVSTLGVFAAGFAFDQLTKLWALSSLADGTEIELLPSVSFRLAFNPGVAFSLGAEYGAVTAFVVLIILTALTTWIATKAALRHRFTEVAILALVAGGGWGNMYDRIFRANDGPLTGHVVDMIAVDWFAIFNFGDVLVVCGMIAWVAYGLFGSGGSHRTAEQSRPSPPLSTTSSPAARGPSTGSGACGLVGRLFGEHGAAPRPQRCGEVAPNALQSQSAADTRTLDVR